MSPYQEILWQVYVFQKRFAPFNLKNPEHYSARVVRPLMQRVTTVPSNASPRRNFLRSSILDREYVTPLAAALLVLFSRYPISWPRRAAPAQTDRCVRRLDSQHSGRQVGSQPRPDRPSLSIYSAIALTISPSPPTPPYKSSYLAANPRKNAGSLSRRRG